MVNTPTMPPRWLTYRAAAQYCGLSSRTLLNYELRGLIKVANLIQPGSRRGRKLVDRTSLDELIESSIGQKTLVPICKPREAAAAR